MVRVRPSVACVRHPRRRRGCSRRIGCRASDLLKLRSVSAVQVSPDGDARRLHRREQRRRRTSVRPALGDDARRRQDRPLRRRQGVVGQSGMVAGRPVDRLSRPRRRQERARRRATGRHRRAFVAEMSGTNARCRRHGTDGRLVARRQADRVRLVGARAGDGRRDRRSDGDHALSLQAGRRRGDDALQRQPPAAHLRRRRRDRARVEQLTDGTHYEHSIDWSPNGRRDRVRLEPRAERGSVLQLRPVHAEAGRQVDPPADARPRAPSTTRAGRPTARRSRTRRPSAASPISRRRWRTRTSG